MLSSAFHFQDRVFISSKPSWPAKITSPGKDSVLYLGGPIPPASCKAQASPLLGACTWGKRISPTSKALTQSLWPALLPSFNLTGLPQGPPQIPSPQSLEGLIPRAWRLSVATGMGTLPNHGSFISPSSHCDTRWWKQVITDDLTKLSFSKLVTTTNTHSCLELYRVPSLPLISSHWVWGWHTSLFLSQLSE